MNGYITVFQYPQVGSEQIKHLILYEIEVKFSHQVFLTPEIHFLEVRGIQVCVCVFQEGTQCYRSEILLWIRNKKKILLNFETVSEMKIHVLEFFPRLEKKQQRQAAECEQFRDGYRAQKQCMVTAVQLTSSAYWVRVSICAGYIPCGRNQRVFLPHVMGSEAEGMMRYDPNNAPS